jgi:hypothetical protein
VTTDGDSIYFNNRYSADPDRYRKALSENKRDGFGVPGTPTGVAHHEFGHALSEFGLGTGGAELIAERQAAKEGRPTSEFVSQHISKYAASNQLELSAEAFADVMANGPNASRLSRAIVDTLGQYYSYVGRTE